MRLSVGVTGLFVAGGWACTAAAKPSDAEIHRMAAEAVQKQVSAPSPVLLHPLLIQRQAGGSLNLEHASFNAFDSSSIPEVLSLAGSEFTLCSTNRIGTCEVPRGQVAIVLSELQDLEQNGVAVGVVVIDGRDGRPRQQYFVVRVNARSDAWGIVEVRAVT